MPYWGPTFGGSQLRLALLLTIASFCLQCFFCSRFCSVSFTMWSFLSTFYLDSSQRFLTPTPQSISLPRKQPRCPSAAGGSYCDTLWILRKCEGLLEELNKTSGSVLWMKEIDSGSALMSPSHLQSRETWNAAAYNWNFLRKTEDGTTCILIKAPPFARRLGELFMRHNVLKMCVSAKSVCAI